MNIEIRRAKKKQGRWWLVTLNGFEIHRLPNAKDARRFAKTVPQAANEFWMAAEPLET